MHHRQWPVTHTNARVHTHTHHTHTNTLTHHICTHTGDITQTSSAHKPDLIHTTHSQRQHERDCKRTRTANNPRARTRTHQYILSGKALVHRHTSHIPAAPRQTSRSCTQRTRTHFDTPARAGKACNRPVFTPCRSLAVHVCNDVRLNKRRVIPSDTDAEHTDTRYKGCPPSGILRQTKQNKNGEWWYACMIFWCSAESH